MTTVVVMSQPLRLANCVAYLNHHVSSDDVLLLTQDANVLSGIEIGSTVRIQGYDESEGHATLPSGGIRQRLVSWSRSGSYLGMKAVQLVRAFSWRLRFLRRLAVVGRMRKTDHVNIDDMNAQVTKHLEAVHQEHTITELICFDLFDLPALSEFGRKHDVPVVVR